MIDAHMRAIYSEVDSMAQRGQFVLMDSCVSGYVGCPHETELCVAVLTATLPWKAELPTRVALFSRLRRYLTAQGADAASILKGLE